MQKGAIIGACTSPLTALTDNIINMTLKHLAFNGTDCKLTVNKGSWQLPVVKSCDSAIVNASFLDLRNRRWQTETACERDAEVVQEPVHTSLYRDLHAGMMAN